MGSNPIWESDFFPSPPQINIMFMRMSEEIPSYMPYKYLISLSLIRAFCDWGKIAKLQTLGRNKSPPRNLIPIKKIQISKKNDWHLITTIYTEQSRCIDKFWQIITRIYWWVPLTDILTLSWSVVAAMTDVLPVYLDIVGNSDVWKIKSNWERLNREI